MDEKIGLIMKSIFEENPILFQKEESLMKISSDSIELGMLTF